MSGTQPPGTCRRSPPAAFFAATRKPVARRRRRTERRRGLRRSAGAAGMAALLALATAVPADEFLWQGQNNTVTNWKNGNQWTNLTAGTTGSHPGAGDVARLMVPVDNWTTLDIEGGAAVGSIHARPRWGSYRIRASWSGSPTWTFDNLGGTSLISVGHASGGGYTTYLHVGSDQSAMRINFANDVLICNSVTGSQGHGAVVFGAMSTLVGGSPENRRTIITQGFGPRQIGTTVSSSAASFVGDWVVDGASAKLIMPQDRFGDAGNTATLRNDGLLALGTDFNWTRDLVVERSNGRMTVEGTFTNSTGRFVFPAENGNIGTLAVTGAVFLGAGSTLAVPDTLPAGTYPLVTATVSLDGAFGRTLWPDDRQGLCYELRYEPMSVTLLVHKAGTLVTAR